MIHNPNTSRK